MKHRERVFLCVKNWEKKPQQVSVGAIGRTTVTIKQLRRRRGKCERVLEVWRRKMTSAAFRNRGLADAIHSTEIKEGAEIN